MISPDPSPIVPSADALASPPPDVMDLRGTPCPINFVRIKLKLTQMAEGELLTAWLDGGEPIEQVPDSLKMEGYQIVAIEDCQDYFVLKVLNPD